MTDLWTVPATGPGLSGGEGRQQATGQSAVTTERDQSSVLTALAPWTPPALH